MKRFMKLFPTIAVVAAFAAAPTHTAKPGQTVNLDGSPSGEHSDLNILVVLLFASESVLLPEQGNPVYGNVVFVPSNGNIIY